MLRCRDMLVSSGLQNGMHFLTKPILNKRLVLFCQIFWSPPTAFFFCITFIPVHVFIRACRCISEYAIVPG